MSSVVSSRRNSIISVNSGSRNESSVVVKKGGDFSVQGLSNINLSISGGSRNESSILIKKGGDTTLQGLTNVNSSNLQDGYTIVYDSETNTWVTSPITLTLVSLDGGTY